MSANELELRFRVAAGRERHCVGTVDRSKDGSTRVQCDSPAASARQCDRCQTKENIAAANMHQAHRRGRDAIGKAMAAYLTHPHRLYVAIFRDGSTKVGTTRGLSGGNRLVEQGAWYARYVAQADDGNASVRGFLDRLGVDAGISDHQQTGLLELLGLLVREGTRCEAPSDALGASVLRVLKDSTLTEGTGANADHIGRVLNGHNHAGGKHQLLPSLTQVKDVEAVGTGLPDVLLHLHVRVVGANVNTGGQHLLHILVTIVAQSGGNEVE